MSLKRIVLHWSAGAYKPCKEDLEHYHFAVDNEGIVHKGKFCPEDNVCCSDGCYAQHTGGGNTNAIGVALCAMAGFKGPKSVGRFPITAIQLESALKLCANLCKLYKIDTDEVITHYEFGKANPQTSSAGKIDIIYLPPHPNVKANEVGGFLRNKVRWYLQHT